MKGIFIFCLLVATLPGVSAKDEGQKQTPQSSPAPASTIAAPQLTITSQPSGTVPATPEIERGIVVKGAGELFFSFPQEWRDRLARVSEGEKWFDSIQFQPKTGDEFASLVAINNVGATNAGKLDLQAVLTKAWQSQSNNAVEKSLDIHDLQGPQIKGFYFVMTDKNRTIAAPVAGEYLYLTQGYAKIDTLVLSFRLVSNRLLPEQEQMLEMIKTARFVKK